MQQLSYLRLALSLGWKMPYALETLNELLVLCQPAHIQMLAEKAVDTQQQDFLRATLFRRKIKQ